MMVGLSGTGDTLAVTAEIEGRSLWQDAVARLRRNRAAVVPRLISTSPTTRSMSCSL